ncbi:MAG TPA: hypothetical protein VIH28_08480 [Ignavibacteriaceae bacterium]
MRRFRFIGYPIKKMHKETDLGYFSGLALQSIVGDPNWITNPVDAAKKSVEYAKALIEELRKEGSND